MTTAPLRIAIAGLGTVGAAVVGLLQRNTDTITARAGRPIDIVAVSARNRSLDRGVPLDGYAWCDDAPDMARDVDCDIVVELIGGSNGPALATVNAALQAGRDVVTANKALLAVHGAEIAALADAQSRTVAYEAAVAAAIPVIKAVREGLAANPIDGLRGILNGTCNFILTEMERTGRPFAEVLAEAQALGFAEADPTFDVDGIDAAHKLALLAALAFGAEPDFDGVITEGIRNISAEDMRIADNLGYRIKLLGIATLADDGLEQRVQPCLVRKDAAIANIEGSTNAVVVDGRYSDPVLLAGRGAGADPTASAVVADLIDIARDIRPPMFGVKAADLTRFERAPSDKHERAFYVRLQVLDRPGVFADLAATLRDHDVSMESVLQKSRAPGEPVSVILTMHEAPESAVRAAFDAVEALDAVIEPPAVLRIEPC